MPVPTEQVMQLIADNQAMIISDQAMIDKLKKQLKTEQDACAHARLLFNEQTSVNKRQAGIIKKQAQDISDKDAIIKKQAQENSDQLLIIKKLRELLSKVE